MDPVAQYTPREMLELMNQMPRPTDFLSSMVVGRRLTTNKTIIEIDKVIGNQAAARYVSRQGGPNIIGKAGYGNAMHVAPYIYEQLPYTPSDLEVRQAGETIYANPADYVSSRVEEWLADLEDRFVRVEEIQVAQALQTGVVPVTGKDVDYEVDFNQKATHLLDVSGTAPWDDAGTDKLAQIETWCERIDDTGAPGPEWIIGERSAMNELLKDEAILALLDNRRVERGEINIKLIREQRATYLGTIRGIGFDLDLYSYQGRYDDVSSGTAVSTRYMNDNTIILGSSQADVRFHYAKIENFKSGDFIGQRFPNRWESPDGKQRFLTMESSPLVGLHQTDAFISVIVK